MTRRTWCVGAVAVFCLASGALHAQSSTLEWGEEYAKRIKATELVSPLSDDVFGDQVNLFNGTVSFSATDISLPGNSALAVELVRTYDTQDVSSGRPLGQWDLDLPRLSGVHPANQPWAPAQRCSTVAAPPSIDTGQYMFLADDYWSGNRLQTRSGGGDLLAITADPKLVKPAIAADFKWATRDGWFLSCLPSLKSGHSGEGFLAYAPDGTTYHFDWMVLRVYPWITKKEPSILQTGVVDRRSVRLYASLVEDRFGNWVKYEWSGDRLVRIHANDGREITLAYEPTSGRLLSATAAGRTWTYESDDGFSLSSVLQPDGSRWRYDSQTGIESGSPNRIEYEPDFQDPLSGALQRDDEYYCWPTNLIKEQTPGFTITHPAGATARFLFSPIRHGRTNVRLRCMTGTDDDWRTDFNDDALTHEVMSLKSKLITGPGLTESVYTYEYSGLDAGYAPKNAFDDTLTGATPPPHYKYVAVTRPDGSRLVNRFGKDHLLNEGQLMQVDVINAQGQLLRSTLNTYITDAEAEASPFPASVGHNLVWSGDPLSAAALRPVKSSTITQQAVAFTSQTLTFDAHARSLEVQKSSALGSKTDATYFHDDLSRWVLGQVKKTTTDGVVASETGFDPATVLPIWNTSFGKLQNTLGYNADGTLRAITDEAGNTTTLDSWRRGIPQSITFADATAKSAVVNDDGTIASVSDENGHLTQYAYNAMGRLERITYPGDWNPTTLSFTRVDATEFGIPAGHWRHLLSTGDSRKYTYFDGLWRPLLTQEFDAANQAATQRFQRSRFDYAGRAIFSSYASTGSDPAIGTWTQFDALGRPTVVSQDSEHGLLSTVTEYLPGLLTRTTNPRGHSTTTSYQAFEAPDTSLPVQIQAPEGVTTTIGRDIFGKPEVLTRSGQGN